ncbi:hypothetical protein [Streptomyces bluensis]|uniref:hypothetical protein n=1 Tax=Streptomyces bluensis TaxID=33897 RepID=UPI0033279AA8
MSTSKTDTMVHTHAERYVTRTGRHPYTDCWPWAEAVLAWSRANEQHLGLSLRSADLDDGDIEHVPAAIAETLRLNMARHQRTPGDLGLDSARQELWYWVCGRGYPAPGTPGWPEPTGPYADRWRAAFLPSNPQRAERLASAADDVLHGLLFHAAKDPQRKRAADYRLHTYNIDYVALADAAPAIGITMPVAVKDPLAYQGIEGLTTVQEAA